MYSWYDDDEDDDDDDDDDDKNDDNDGDDEGCLFALGNTQCQRGRSFRCETLAGILVYSIQGALQDWLGMCRSVDRVLLHRIEVFLKLLA